MLSLARQNGAKFRRLGEARYLGRGRLCVRRLAGTDINASMSEDSSLGETSRGEDVQRSKEKERKRKNIVRTRSSNHFFFPSNFSREILLEKSS